MKSSDESTDPLAATMIALYKGYLTEPVEKLVEKCGY